MNQLDAASRALVYIFILWVLLSAYRFCRADDGVASASSKGSGTVTLFVPVTARPSEDGSTIETNLTTEKFFIKKELSASGQLVLMLIPSAK